jgi:hypothetical protein
MIATGLFMSDWRKITLTRTLNPSPSLRGMWANHGERHRETPIVTADRNMHVFCHLGFHKEAREVRHVRHVRLGSDNAFFDGNPTSPRILVLAIAIASRPGLLTGACQQGRASTIST